MKVTKIPFWPAMPTDNKDAYTPRLKLTPLQGKMMISALALLLLTLGTATGLALTGQSQDLYSSASCDAGQLDITNACNPACCNANSQCPNNQTCTLINGYCQSGTSCDPYSGTDPVTPPPIDCEPGKINQNNQCDPACCDSNSQCTVSGETCSKANGHCKSGTSCGKATSSGSGGTAPTAPAPKPPTTPSQPTTKPPTSTSTTCDPFNSDLPQNQTTAGAICCGQGTSECSPAIYHRDGRQYFLTCNASYGQLGECEENLLAAPPSQSTPSSPSQSNPSQSAPAQTTAPAGDPCPGGSIRQDRSHQNNAIDYYCPNGTVYSLCDGVVKEVVENAGLWVYVKCNNGDLISFLHLSDSVIRPGTTVSSGSPLGEIHPTASGTNDAHVHIELNNGSGNPLDYINHPGGDNLCEQYGGTCQSKVEDCPSDKQYTRDPKRAQSCSDTSKGSVCCSTGGQMTSQDYGALFKFWGQVVNALNAHADFNEDGKIGPLDYVILFDNWTL